MVDQILNIFEPYPNIKAIVSTCANNGYDSDMDQIVAVDSWHLLATQGAVSKVLFVNKHNAVPQTSRERQLEKHRYLGSPKDGGWPKPMETILSPDSENALRPIIVQIQFFGVPCSCSKNWSYLPILMFECIDLGLKPNM